MEVNELFKHRSITSCMRASYDTITSDFRSLVKQTWTTHVPFAVLLAIVLYFLLPNKPLHDWGAVNPMASFILQTIIYGATIVMAIVSFWHLLPRKQLCPKDEKRKIGKSLLRILRHFGGFFLTSFLGMIIVGIATFIAALPSIILIIAQFYSQLGALDGDPLGVPGFFTPLLFPGVHHHLPAHHLRPELAWHFTCLSIRLLQGARRRETENEGKPENGNYRDRKILIVLT